MKLEAEALTALMRAFSVCQAVKINEVVVDANSIRGLNAERTATMISPASILSADVRMALRNLKDFTDRVDLLLKSGGCDVQLTVNTSTKFVQAVTLSHSRTKLNYNCCNPDVLKIPTALGSDGTYNCSFEVQKASVDLLSGASSILSKTSKDEDDRVVILVKDGVVTFEIRKETNDVFTHVVDESAQMEEEDSVLQFYPLQVLIPALRLACSESSSAAVQLSPKGALQVQVLGHPVTIFAIKG